MWLMYSQHPEPCLFIFPFPSSNLYLYGVNCISETLCLFEYFHEICVKTHHFQPQWEKTQRGLSWGCECTQAAHHYHHHSLCS